MAFRMDIRSLIVGLLVGLAAVFILGVASGSKEGVYQFSMAAVGGTDTSQAYVVYGRMHTGTGKIETWKYLLHANRAIPHRGDNTSILSTPDSRD